MEPDPVKYLIGMIFKEERYADRALRFLGEREGDVDFVSPPFPFDETDYYRDEMGAPLYRKFFTFSRLRSPGDLVGLKLVSRDVEEELKRQGSRTVNLDPGYMDFGKIVLASFKYKVNKIYLDRGVYADPVLYYEKRTFLPHPWTFPDMRGGRYEETFLHVRSLYRETMKRVRENR